MATSKTIKKWSELYKLNVIVPSEGKSVGQVEDFFFKEGSNAIYALRVHTRVNGDLTLPITGITAITDNSVAIENAQMLTKAIPPFALGHNLVGRKVVSEHENDLGSVKDVVLGIEPLVAMRVAGFEITHGRSERSFGADGVASYQNGTVVVHDQLAKKLR